MHLVIDQLMAHSHLRYKGEGPQPPPSWPAAFWLPIQSQSPGPQTRPLTPA